MPNDGTKRPKEIYKLFIDELGTSNLKDFTSNQYILSGVLIKESECQNIKIWADQIKFKYWGHTNIIFHSREIGRKENEFKIFCDKTIFNSFVNDLNNLLIKADFKILCVVLDKENARNVGWNNIKVYKDTNMHLIRNYILSLLQMGTKGKIIMEYTSAQKDIYLLGAFSYYLGAGIPEYDIGQGSVKEILTSVSFVTKQNHDIEEQLADMFAYIAKIKYSSNFNKKSLHYSDYDEMMLKVFHTKSVKNSISSHNPSFTVDSFKVLP